MVNSRLPASRTGAPPIPVPVVEIHNSLATVAAVWREFEPRAATTLYQSYLWCSAWLETCGASSRIAIRVAVVRDHGGAVLAIWPFQIRHSGPVRILEWLGSSHAAYGYGLYAAGSLDHAQDWAPAAFARALDAIGAFDVAVLADMPEALDGAPHPLTAIFTTRSANVSFQTALERDFEALHMRKRDREDRRTARKKESHLALIGELGFGLPESRADLHAALDEMLDLHVARMAEIGVRGVASPAERAFLHRLADAQEDGRPLLLPYRLACGGETLAVMLGARHGGTFWALISALAAGPTRKYSPGDLALRKTIRACCEAGLRNLDLSAGDSRYKRAWADIEIRLHHHVSARNLRGLAFATLIALRMTVKRTVKTSPVLFGLALTIRRRLFGQS